MSFQPDIQLFMPIHLLHRPRSAFVIAKRPNRPVFFFRTPVPRCSEKTMAEAPAYAPGSRKVRPQTVRSFVFSLGHCQSFFKRSSAILQSFVRKQTNCCQSVFHIFTLFFSKNFTLCFSGHCIGVMHVLVLPTVAQSN